MTFPCVNTIHLGRRPFSLSPPCQKKLFTLSFHAKFLKIRFAQLTCTYTFLMYMYIFFLLVLITPRAYLGKIVPLCAASNTQKMTKSGPIQAEIGKKRWCYHIFVKERMKAFDKPRILALLGYFYHFLFSRYGRLMSNFLCGRYSHCIFSFCSVELTRTRNTWSLTAVSYYTLQVHLMGLAFSNSGEGALFYLALVGCGAVVLIICLQCVVLWKVGDLMIQLMLISQRSFKKYR